jgi:pimeloyl-ACP methyl ester carboxylesterase
VIFIDASGCSVVTFVDERGGDYVNRTGRRVTVAFAGAVTLVSLLPGAAVAAPTPDGAGAVPPIAWAPCADAPDVDCGTVTVPIDWSRKNGPTIQIALARRRATDPAARIGTLVMDPGGPGGPGAQTVKRGQLFSDELHRHYDVVGFDPRGVGESSPVLCEETTFPAFDEPKNQAQFEELRAFNRAWVDNCRRTTGPLYDFVDTNSVARDMDVIRAGLGEKRLNYLGISYGTLMGTAYAELFPQRVGRFVLDSNMDHSVRTTWGFVSTESRGAEENFDQFVAWCDRSEQCIQHGRDVRAIHHEILKKAESGELVVPTPDGDLVVTPLRYLSEINGAFYGPDWRYISELIDLLESVGAGVPKQAPAGAFAVSVQELVHDPFTAVFCEDWRLPVHSYAELKALRVASEVLVAPDMQVSPLGWGATLGCIGLEDRVRNPQHDLRIKGVDSLLMVNSRYDPATPWQWATNAASQAKAPLLRYDGWGHFAYEKSPCVSGKTDAFLITGKLPARGASCPAVEPDFGAGARRAPTVKLPTKRW